MTDTSDLKKVAVVGCVGLPAQYGGWETLADYLTQELAEDYEFTVFCSSKKYDDQLESYNGAKLRYIDYDANGIQSIIYDLIGIWHSFRSSDAVLILGVSGCIFLGFFRMFSKAKLVVNIDGLEWKRQKWGRFAKVFLWLSEYVAVKAAHVVIADNVAIQKYISNKYNVESVFIPYGADHVGRSVPDEASPRIALKQYAFKVCRIEPENNVRTIIEAFVEQDNYDLVIVGNWKNSAYGKDLYSEFSGESNIHLYDPIYDLERLNELRCRAKLYVHGHSAGGTNPSLVEAMHIGLPIIAKDVSYNVATTNGRAKYFTDKESLLRLLVELFDDELNSVAEDMSKIAKSQYTWKNVARSYAAIF